MCHHLEEFRHRQITTVVYQCKHAGVVQPYAHFSHPQQNVAIIGGHVARNMQNIAAIQTKWVKEMQTSLMNLDAFT
jgi:hypothetical protein